MGARLLGAGDEATLEAFLRRHADSSMFLLSNLARAGIEDRGAPYQATYAGWFEGDRLEAVAAHAWNRSVILQAPVRAGEVARAAARGSGRPVGGLVGPWAHVAEARRSLGLEGAPVQYERNEDRMAVALHRLVTPPALADGRLVCRAALARDVALLAGWRAEMAIESLDAKDGRAMRASYREAVERQAKAGEIWVLEDGGVPVATAAFNATAPPAVQVGGVWTPPERRNRGYARAAVAGSLLDARARGADRAVLFTGNPAARRAYEAIGFRTTGDYGLLLLASPVAIEPR